MSKVSMMDVKEALKDRRFRATLPQDLEKKVNKFLENPGCPCNVPLYREILKNHRDKLKQYFPGQDISDETEALKHLAENHWSVINCKIDEVEDRLKKLPPGRKQIAMARYGEEITIVVNELDIVY